MQQEADANERRDWVDVPGPFVGAEDECDEETAAHERVKTSFGEPEFCLRLHDGRRLRARSGAGAHPDDKTDDCVDSEEDDAGERAFGLQRFLQMLRGVRGDVERRQDHHAADANRDEVLQLADAVCEAVIGRTAHGAHGEERGEYGERVRAFLEHIAKDGDGVGVERNGAHQREVDDAEGEREFEAAFAGAGAVCGHEGFITAWAVDGCGAGCELR